MAQNLIILTLDTTAPIIEVVAPSYANRQNQIEIKLKANETLSSEWQEIYVIDSEGVRHDLTLKYNAELNEYAGVTIFEGYPIGVSTIYARLMDEVGNISAQVSQTIKIVEPVILNITLSERVLNSVSTSIKPISTIDINEELRNRVSVKEDTYRITTNDKLPNTVTINSKEVK